MSIQDISPSIISVLNRTDWSSAGFSIDKAWVCLSFAELAYRHIPSYEADSRGRVKVVPCLEYQRIVLEKKQVNIGRELAELDIPEFFIVERRFAVVLGVVTPKVVFIAIRGTKQLYDWAINLDLRRVKSLNTIRNAYFHKGFFRAIASCTDSVIESISQYTSAGQKDLPIYVTGHSLGGAMAAILNAFWSRARRRHFYFDVIHPFRNGDCVTYDAYSFGSPRYCSTAATTLFESPYHIYNEADIVPSLPPRWLGYEDAFREYRIDGKGLERQVRRETVRFLNWITSLAIGRGIREHRIEVYRELLSKHVRMSRDPYGS